MTARVRRWAAALVQVLSGAGVACHAEPCKPIDGLHFSAPEPHRYRQDVPRAEDRVAVVGDTQRTSFEGCELGNEVNDREQRALLADLARQNPAAVVLLGDMVFRGNSPRHWAYFDHLMAESRVGEKPLFPLLGNHEYWIEKTPDLSGARARFAQFEKSTYYAFTWGGVRMVMLDANHEKLGEAEVRRQMSWLDCEIDRVNRGCTRGMILFSHQSPFTQSPWVRPDAALQNRVLPKFCGSSRKLFFISAHAHGYERWMDVPIAGCREAHTPFIVSAGGGGPRPPDRRSGAPHDAASFHEWPRPFNYLLLSQSETSVSLEVHALRKGEDLVIVAPEETQRAELAARVPVPASCDCPL